MNFAHVLMKLALITAPDNRIAWAHAMSAEFAALDRNRVAWAAGCLGAAFTWRVQSMALYLVALATLPILWNVVIGTAIFAASTTYAFSRPIGQEEMGRLWMAISGAGTQCTFFLMAAFLCAYRPRYALVSVVTLWLATTGVTFLSTFAPAFAPLVLNAPFSAENNHPALPNIVMALAFAGADMWPVVVGGLAGWAFARGRSGVLAASALLALALMLGFANFFMNPGNDEPAYMIFTMTADTIVSAALLFAIIFSSVAAARDLRRAWRSAA